MIGLPKVGESVKFSINEGHRVPRCGRQQLLSSMRRKNVEPHPEATVFYQPGEVVTEKWSNEHHVRFLAGAFRLIEWSGAPKAQRPPDTDPDHEAWQKVMDEQQGKVA